jgi:putative tricarboxylic transport membrane protein
MIGFGALGYLMTKYDFGPAGVLLGIILGPIVENGLRDLLIISDGAPIAFILTRPIALAPYFSFKSKPREGETSKFDD